MARTKSRKPVPAADTPGPGVARRSVTAVDQLPSVDTMVATLGANGTAAGLSASALTSLVRGVLAEARESLLAESVLAGDRLPEHRVVSFLASLAVSRVVPVINATGIIVHTNLGRAPVSEVAARAMAAAAGGAVALEIDPESNRRGGRMGEIARLMRLLTGAELTVVVNNNAAGILLVLAALGDRAEIVLSRGESVEIGGGFRIPDVLRQSGGDLVEVGTTNRTYAADYERAITPRTAALLKVHPSNFRMSGFVHEATLAEVAAVGRAADVPVIYDQGNGLLIDGAPFGLPPELSVSGAIAAGATVVTASGDKLLGGPQAGLICGSAEIIEKISSHPWARAVRADKTCLAGTVATLRHYLASDHLSRVPVWQMISATVDSLRTRADHICDAVAPTGVVMEIRQSEASPGGGSYPGVVLPSVALHLTSPSSADALARALRTGTPGVFGRIEDERVIFDLRSVLPRDDHALAGAIRAALEAEPAVAGTAD
ncbi:MAG: L-seryl-tRNA(Sec) selenium transferase [uncultured Thermomicrobiales bacterium]|uniref:L-seryl-tRNA(Sec) selenium transferase n=1 Tax=uncultured Thermomicrobiales bacterium TaxID=1645740 RepID=A0A6J4UQM2_9BACT|nr:MAG: L-seryl-tRNA(Sec) selenium transferase [uncultured Thermomicrobiales bacterium]